MNPKISVIMPVYNGGLYLDSAVKSILNQSLTNFEFIIIDDGSTDSTGQQIEQYAAVDNRIIALRNPVNQGIVYTLNRGLLLARGTYIARMDADDVSTPNRFEKQVSYLDQHPEIGVLGTNLRYIDPEGSFLNEGRLKHMRPESSPFIHWSLLWRCAIYHTTVMFRRSLIEETGFQYDESYKYAEDYDLWTRLMHHTRLFRLHDTVVDVRLLTSGISTSRSQQQRELTIRIRCREIQRYIDDTQNDKGLETLCQLFSMDVPHGDFKAASDLLLKLMQRFLAVGDHHQAQSEIVHDAAQRQVQIAYAAARATEFRLALRLFWHVRRFSARQLISRYTLIHLGLSVRLGCAQLVRQKSR